MWSKEATGQNNPYIRIITVSPQGDFSERFVGKDSPKEVADDLPLAVIVVAPAGQSLPESLSPSNLKAGESRPLQILIATTSVPFDLNESLPRGFDASFTTWDADQAALSFRLARALLSPLEEAQTLNCDHNDIRWLVNQGKGSTHCLATLGRGRGTHAIAQAVDAATQHLRNSRLHERPGAILISVTGSTAHTIYKGTTEASKAVSSWNSNLQKLLTGEVLDVWDEVEVGIYFFSGPESKSPEKSHWKMPEMTAEDIPLVFRDS